MAKSAKAKAKAYDEELEALSDIENQKSEKLLKMRSHERLSMKLRVLLHPGNASDSHKQLFEGVTGDLSSGGCKILFPLPVQVGDVYRIEFDQDQIKLPVVYAKCMRCRMIHARAFEAGMAFFAPIDLRVASSSPEKNDDLFG